MKDNARIINVSTIMKDGQLYLQYTIENNGDIKEFERPYYDQNGNIDPEVANILEIAKKIDSRERETEKPVRDLVVYTEPSSKFKISRNTLGTIAAGLAGVLIGVGIMAATRGCSKQQNSVNQDVPTNDDTVIEQNDDEMKISYMTEEEFTSGVKALTNYVNETLGFDYKPVDLTSLYFSANMSHISNDLFKKLVTECYLPDTDMDIALNTLSALDSLQSTIGVEGTSKDRIDFDFSKLFVDKTAVEVNEYYKTKYNSVKSASKETTQEIVKELESYMFMDSTKGYNNLAAGERLAFNNYVADAIAIAASAKGVSMSSAFDTTINETTVTDYINSLTDKMNCLAVTEAEKVLTK